jgi:putative ABC transport system permease protein
MVVVVIAMLASCVATMAVTLSQEASGPFDRAFAQQRGAHLVVLFNAAGVHPAKLRAGHRLPDVTALGGPWPAREVAFSGAPVSRGTPPMKFGAMVMGRDESGGAVERLRISGGRWIRSHGEIVVTRALADAAAVHVGQRIYALVNRRKTPYAIVGEAVDVNLPANWLPQKAWVQATDPLVSTGKGLQYEVAYRFRQASTTGEVAQGLKSVTLHASPGALVRAFSWLDARADVNVLATMVMTFLLAFSVFALVACAFIVANIVAGAVLAGYRDIGILKSVGFTPAQVIGVFSGQMLVPALAGCVLGVPLGALGSRPILQNVAGAMDLPAPSGVAPSSDLLVVAGILLVVAVAAAAPARRAGRLNAFRAITLGSAPERGHASRVGRLLDAWGAPRFLSLGAGQAFARRLRGALTVVAVLVGVTTLTFSVGFHAVIDRVATDPAFHSLDYVGGNYQVRVMPRGGYTDRQVKHLLQAQRGTAYVVAYADIFVTAPGVSDPVQAIGVRGNATSLGYHAQSGVWFRRPGEVVLGGAAAKAMHRHVGSVITIRYQGRHVRLRVVGIYFDITSSGRVMRFSYADLLRLSPSIQPYNYAVKLRPGVATASYARRLQRAEPDFISVQLNNQAEPQAVVLLRGVVTTLAVILGLIAVVGVFNTVLLNTRERLRDIAILKALGMSPAEVVAMVVASAGVIGVLGGVVGVPAGMFLEQRVLALMAGLVGSSTVPGGTGAVLNLGTLTLLALTGVVLSVAGAALPAWWAACAPVVEALHAE